MWYSFDRALLIYYNSLWQWFISICWKFIDCNSHNETQVMGVAGENVGSGNPQGLMEVNAYCSLAACWNHSPISVINICMKGPQRSTSFTKSLTKLTFLNFQEKLAFNVSELQVLVLNLLKNGYSIVETYWLFKVHSSTIFHDALLRCSSRSTFFCYCGQNTASKYSHRLCFILNVQHHNERNE